MELVYSVSCKLERLGWSDDHLSLVITAYRLKPIVRVTQYSNVYIKNTKPNYCVSQAFIAILKKKKKKKLTLQFSNTRKRHGGIQNRICKC